MRTTAVGVRVSGNDPSSETAAVGVRVSGNKIHHIIIIIIIKLPTRHKFRSEQKERPSSRFSTIGWGRPLRSDFNLY